jgi:hypothetical protein
VLVGFLARLRALLLKMIEKALPQLPLDFDICSLSPLQRDLPPLLQELQSTPAEGQGPRYAVCPFEEQYSRLDDQEGAS